ncbi:peptidoglycan DD-metalloendopeptidase family protein [Bacillus salitolerans]|uniref:Peptidoglycan DD-metalloendopeptidase family protein n=1 Tax=Bacillus salitolerans TaxID=1437434 RepID=A0ABW4LVR7_9BACI
MQDISKRLLVVIIMGFCIACMFLSVKTVKAEQNENTYKFQETKDWVWPALGEISDLYGSRSGNHHGLDIAAPTGTETVSVEDGIVTKSYYSFSYGHVVFISHPNGFETVYAHLNKRFVVKGQKVKKGELIGHVGNTGRSRGAHLHFEVHKGTWNYSKSNAIDPLQALDVSVLIEMRVNKEMEMKKEAIQVAKLEEIDQKQDHSGWMMVQHSEGFILSSSLVVESSDVDHSFLEKSVEIVVTEGMTLWELSQEYKVAIQSIAKWNNLTSDMLVPGQHLSLYPNMEKVYIVKSGDTLPKIGKELQLSVEEIVHLNGLKNDHVFPSQILLVSKGT